MVTIDPNTSSKVLIGLKYEINYHNRSTGLKSIQNGKRKTYEMPYPLHLLGRPLNNSIICSSWCEGFYHISLHHKSVHQSTWSEYIYFMLSLCKSLTDLSDVQISYKMNKFKLKIAFCTILNYITANRLNQISQVLTCDARYRAQKKLTCMLKISMPHFKFSHYFYFHDTLKKLRRKKLKRLNCIYPREYEEGSLPDTLPRTYHRWRAEATSKNKGS